MTMMMAMKLTITMMVNGEDDDDRNGGKDVHAGDDGDKEDGELKNI